LANIDPIDFKRATDGLDPEETLVLVNSKTFTTAETMLNAKTVRNWIFEAYRAKGENLDTEEAKAAVVSKHIIACSTAKKLTTEFGIDPNNVFEFWDWVGGRFSVWSGIGMVPLSITFGFDYMKKFLDGGNSVDKHFRTTTDVRKNIPVMLALLGFYHTSC